MVRVESVLCHTHTPTPHAIVDVAVVVSSSELPAGKFVCCCCRIMMQKGKRVDASKMWKPQR